MTPTAKALVERAREALSGATKEPWRYGALEFGGRAVVDGSGYFFAQVDDDGNGRFIAASRTLVPDLLAEVSRLQKLCEEACGIGEHVTRIARSHGSVIETARLAEIRAAVGGSDE
jgi:hypothetical protein